MYPKQKSQDGFGAFSVVVTLQIYLAADPALVCESHYTGRKRMRTHEHTYSLVLTRENTVAFTGKEHTFFISLHTLDTQNAFPHRFSGSCEHTCDLCVIPS